MIHGYAKVSTDGQTVAAQVQQLTAAGCGRIFSDNAGAGDRAQLRRALSHLEAGDLLLVTRLDRLAHSVRGLLAVFSAVAERKANLRSLNEAWADTTAAHERLMRMVIEGLTEFDLGITRVLTTEGRARAKARGQSLGRPHRLSLHDRREALQRKEAGEPIREIARSYAVSPSTICRLKP